MVREVALSCPPKRAPSDADHNPVAQLDGRDSRYSNYIAGVVFRHPGSGHQFTLAAGSRNWPAVSASAALAGGAGLAWAKFSKMVEKINGGPPTARPRNWRRLRPSGLIASRWSA